LLERQCLSHALNSKAVAKRYARECGERYESLRLIVAHLGSGISVSAHENGRMVDVTNSREEGAFSTERAGEAVGQSVLQQPVHTAASGRAALPRWRTILLSRHERFGGSGAPHCGWRG